MPKASRTSASVRRAGFGMVSVAEHFAGGWTANFESDSQDLDSAEHFKELPNGECQAMHLGYVFKGRIRYRAAAGEEIFEAGDAYFVKPGHNVFIEAGTEYLEFSPTDEMVRTYDCALANAQAQTDDSRDEGWDGEQNP